MAEPRYMLRERAEWEGFTFWGNHWKTAVRERREQALQSSTRYSGTRNAILITQYDASLWLECGQLERDFCIIIINSRSYVEKETATHSSIHAWKIPRTWWATLHGVAKSQTWLGDFTSWCEKMVNHIKQTVKHSWTFARKLLLWRLYNNTVNAPWLIHVNVWQKPLQYCKVISLQLIKINEKKIQ